MAADGSATSVVIVNYRTADLTAAAARSALGEPEVREIVVVDNASGDASAARLRADLAGTPTRVVESPVNVGFGRGANLGAQHATAPLLLILNSDATLVAGSLAPMAASLLAGANVGLVAPAVYEADGHTLQPGAFGRFPRATERNWGGGPEPPDWVSGVAMLLRREEFLDLGGFDPAFDMYLEDVDLCRRLRERGRAVVREPAASVVHLGGRSWGSTAEKKAKFTTSKLTYFRKAGATRAEMAYIQATRALWQLAASRPLRRAGHP